MSSLICNSKPTMSLVPYKVIYEGKMYDKIFKFDCRNIILENGLSVYPCFSTSLSISTKNYRASNFSPASVYITVNDGWTLFTITDDWGVVHMMEIHNSLKKEIKFAKDAAIEQGLYRRNRNKKYRKKEKF